MDQARIERNLRDALDRLSSISRAADVLAADGCEQAGKIMAQAETARLMIRGACDELGIEWDE